MCAFSSAKLPLFPEICKSPIPSENYDGSDPLRATDARAAATPAPPRARRGSRRTDVGDSAPGLRGRSGGADADTPPPAAPAPNRG